MSRVATNYPNTYSNNGVGQTSTSFLPRPSTNTGYTNSINSNGHVITVRSAAPPPTHKETVHACPICNNPYKDPRLLPCTHTYCLTCIREKLIDNNRVTCPKCHHQVEPFTEADLNDLQPNLILSQGWSLNTRSIPPVTTPKKPVTYQSTQMPKHEDKRKASTTESNGHESTHSHGLASIANIFRKSSTHSGENNPRSSRSSSVSNALANVSNLVRIYSEATTPRDHEQSQQERSRSNSIQSTSKHDELIKIFEQATKPSQKNQPIIKRSSQAYEEIKWDNVQHGTTPIAPPVPDQWQTATEQHHHPPQSPERPLSVASSDRHSTLDNRLSIQQRTPEKNPSSFPQIPTLDSRPSTASRSRIDSDNDENEDEDEDEDDDQPRTPIQQIAYATIQPNQHNRQGSYADSIRSSSTSSMSRQSPVRSITNTQQQQRSSLTSIPQPQQLQQQDEKRSYRTPSVASSRQSSENFPPPPPLNLETLDLTNERTPTKLRSVSSISTRSSAYGNMNETQGFSSERFNPPLPPPLPPPIHKTNSQDHSRSSTPTNRPISKALEQTTHYLVPTPSSSLPTTVISRVDSLLSDQKRLEREIEEQIHRLKHDYDDIRKQIERKESSIHNEIKNISARLDDDITQHYHRKQKVYADLAADTNSVGNRLERLKSNTNTNNKQELLSNLEQIELNLRNIRQAVEKENEPQNALTFSEGRRTLGVDTIGQITYHQAESNRHFHSPPPPLQPPLSSAAASYRVEQTSTNITPYKYIKIDHLATLEPESIAISENNKKILLGICNKLFILDEHGKTINVIPLTPSIRGIAISKKPHTQNIAYISHDETVSIVNIESGQIIDSVKETDSTSDSGTFLPLGIDTDNIRGDVFVCDYRNSCVIKFDDKLEFITQWRIYNHSNQYDEARPKLISVYGQRFYMIVEHSCKPYYNQGIAYTFSLHICDANSGNIIKIIDSNSLGTQRLRWPCSVQAINNEKCYILDTMTSGKYFNGHWQKHWSRVLEIGQDDRNVVTELFQLDSEAEAMAMTKQNMVIAANGDILFVDLTFLKQQQPPANNSENEYQNLP